MSRDMRFNPDGIPIELHRDPGGDWTALYVDGELVDGPGDAHNRDEYLQDMFGVTVVDDDAFLRAATGDHRQAAPTVAKIYEYVARREDAKRAAAEKVAQAVALLAEARQLDPTNPRARR